MTVHSVRHRFYAVILIQILLVFVDNVTRTKENENESAKILSDKTFFLISLNIYTVHTVFLSELKSI